MKLVLKTILTTLIWIISQILLLNLIFKITVDEISKVIFNL